MKHILTRRLVFDWGFHMQSEYCNNYHVFTLQGFLTGDSGVLVVSALYYKDIGDAKKAEECIHEYVKICADVHRMKVGDSTGDELFSGRVGYLTGLLELSKAFSNDRVGNKFFLSSNTLFSHLFLEIAIVTH